MTCIAGLAADGKVWLGGDRAAVSDGHYLAHTALPKVFRRGSVLIGYTTSFRMGQLLQYKLSVPERPSEQPLEEFMATAFVDAVRSCLKDGGWAKVDNSQERAGEFLVGCDGRLFTYDGDHNVLTMSCGYDVVGSGISVARGSLHTTAKLDMHPSDRLTAALEAAAYHTTTVRGPFDIICEDENATKTSASLVSIVR